MAIMPHRPPVIIITIHCFVSDLAEESTSCTKELVPLSHMLLLDLGFSLYCPPDLSCNFIHVHYHGIMYNPVQAPRKMFSSIKLLSLNNISVFVLSLYVYK